MSFGYGVGDFIAVITLARKVYESYKDAPTEFKALSNDVNSLNIVIKKLGHQLHLADADLENNLGDDEKFELENLRQCCQNVLTELDEFLTKYKSLHGTGVGSSRYAWDRVKWGKEDMAGFRERIALTIGMVAAFNSSLANCQLALMQGQLNELLGINNAKAEYQNKLKSPSAQRASPSTQRASPSTQRASPSTQRASPSTRSSIITLCSISTNASSKHAWSRIINMLRDEGISASMLEGNKDKIVALIQSATAITGDIAPNNQVKRGVDVDAEVDSNSRSPSASRARYRPTSPIVSDPEDKQSQEHIENINVKQKSRKGNHTRGIIDESTVSKKIRGQRMWRSLRGVAPLAATESSSPITSKRKPRARTELESRPAPGPESESEPDKVQLNDDRVHAEISLTKVGTGGPRQMADDELPARGHELSRACPCTHGQLERLLQGIDFTTTASDWDPLRNIIVSGSAPEHIDCKEKYPIRTLRVALSELVLPAQAGRAPNCESIELQLSTLHIAAQHGQVEVLQQILEQGAEVDETFNVVLNATCSHTGGTALHLAAGHGCLDAVKLLLENGADIEAKWEDQKALTIAISCGHVDITNLLLAKGASLGDVQIYATPTRFRTVAPSNKIKLVYLLLDSGVDINKKGQEGLTALHEAVNYGDVMVVKLLLEKFTGANVDVRNDRGYTPLHLALGPLSERLHPHTRFEVVKVLLNNGADVNVRLSVDGEDPGQTVLHQAADRDDAEAIQLLFEKGADVHAKSASGSGALHRAVSGNKLQAIKQLLQIGANVNARKDDGSTPLHTACAVLDDRIEILKLLLENGAQVNAKSAEGLAALHWVVSKGQYEATKHLLKNGADVNARKQDGTTALHIAARESQTQVLNLLLESGADPNAKSADGSTALHFVSLASLIKKTEAETTMQALIDGGASVDAINDDGRTPLHLLALRFDRESAQLLLKNGANLEAVDSNRQTPLSYAASQCSTYLPLSTSVLALLVEQGANINSVDSKGRTPLLNALKHGRTMVAAYLLEKGAEVNAADHMGHTALSHIIIVSSYYQQPPYSITLPDIFSRLLKQGANVNAADKNGRTALIESTYRAHFDVVSQLLNSNVHIQVNAKDNDGLSALDHAISEQNVSMVSLLLDNGATTNPWHLQHCVSDVKIKEEAKVARILSLLLLSDVCRQSIDVPDDYRKTPLHRAAEAGWPNVMQVLLNHGANINNVDITGATALHLLLMREGSIPLEAINVALKHGANVLQKNKLQKTPLDEAKRVTSPDKADIVELLRKHITRSRLAWMKVIR